MYIKALDELNWGMLRDFFEKFFKRKTAFIFVAY